MADNTAVAAKESFSVTLTNELESQRGALPVDFNIPRFVQNSVALLNGNDSLMKFAQQYGTSQIKQGLLRGAYQQQTVYSHDPASVAAHLAACGAQTLHLVDLDGARDGGTPNLPTVKRILAASGLGAEVGGGIRELSSIERYCALGVERVILGTAAVTDPALVREAVRRWGEQIAVGVDIRDGYAAIRGWRERAPLSAEALLSRLEADGVSTVIVTDISRDGALQGVNLPLYETLTRRFSLRIIASGGVTSAEDIRALRALGLYGAIVGKAWYEHRIDLKEAIAAAL